MRIRKRKRNGPERESEGFIVPFEIEGQHNPGRGKGLWSDLYAATTKDMAGQSYAQDFITTAKNTCFATLGGLVALD